MTEPPPRRARVLQAAGQRCGYCQAQQAYVYDALQVDHLWPRARGGTQDEANLWAACALCNRYKADRTHGRDPVTGRRVRLFHPGRQRWARHFAWSADGTEILGRTACGRATVVTLQLNNDLAVLVRRHWVRAGWHPPADTPR